MKNKFSLKGGLKFSIIFFILISTFLGFLFGLQGIRLSFGILFISIPFYLILLNFKIKQDEKIIFSLILGLTAFPSLVFLLGLVISFRIAIVLVFILLISVAYILKILISKKKKEIISSN